MSVVQGSPTRRAARARVTTICTLAMAAVGASVAQVVVWMNGGPMDGVRALGVVAGAGLGSWLMWLGHCLSEGASP